MSFLCQFCRVLNQVPSLFSMNIFAVKQKKEHRLLCSIAFAINKGERCVKENRQRFIKLSSDSSTLL